MKQWMLRITSYADRLSNDLEGLDWPKSTIDMQRNWIGKSKGTEIIFNIENSDDTFTVFTTRADTLFGCTYCCLAPEHPLVKKLVTNEQKDEVEKYIEETIKSIINQSIGFENIELIIVDDYSTDNTQELINHYCEKYENIKTFESGKKTGTPGRARNIGIANSTAEYIMFIDHDDNYLPESVEKLYNAVTENSCDVAIGKFQTFGEQKIVPEDWITHDVVLNSIDADGTQCGYEINLTKMISENVDVPVIASGGGGTPDHLADVLKEGKADAALIASMVHSGAYTIGSIKNDLNKLGVPVRL